MKVQCFVLKGCDFTTFHPFHANILGNFHILYALFSPGFQQRTSYLLQEASDYNLLKRMSPTLLQALYDGGPFLSALDMLGVTKDTKDV